MTTSGCMKVTYLPGHGATVMQERKVIAVARATPHGYICKAIGFEWTIPEATKPNVFGIVDRRLVVLPAKRAIRLLHSLAKTGERV